MQAKDVTGNQPVRPRPLIFIGSSSEGLDIARALQAALYNEAEPVIWSQGVFGLSGGTLETLLQESDNFDFAVFILSADDLVVKRGQQGNAARDNVLFELGLFMGRLGRDRTFFVYSRTDQLLLPSDLAGVTAASYLPPSEPRYLLAAISAVSSPILAAVQTLGPRATGGIRSASFSKELDDLRGQVAEMRIALASFAAYAQEPPETEGSQKQNSKRDGATDLSILHGSETQPDLQLGVGKKVIKPSLSILMAEMGCLLESTMTGGGRAMRCQADFAGLNNPISAAMLGLR
jgi:CAP12/Pycsar effector protein, TIR domain